MQLLVLSFCLITVDQTVSVSMLFPCLSGKDERSGISTVTILRFPTWLVVYIFSLLTFFFVVIDSVRISDILQKIRPISVSLCYRKVASQLESNYWRL